MIRVSRRTKAIVGFPFRASSIMLRNAIVVVTAKNPLLRLFSGCIGGFIKAVTVISHDIIIVDFDYTQKQHTTKLGHFLAVNEYPDSPGSNPATHLSFSKADVGKF